MRITRDNYEAFLLDRMEGTLSTELSRELEVFLLANPELNPEFNDLPVLDSSEELSGHEKEALKKRLPPAGFELNQLDDLLIAKLEGDICKPQLEKLDALIASDPEVALSWRQIAATKLAATTVQFPQKRKLKKGGVIIPLYRFAAIAASVALLLGALWMFGPADTGTQVVSQPMDNGEETKVEESHNNLVKEDTPIKKVTEQASEKLNSLKDIKKLVAVPTTKTSAKGTSAKFVKTTAPRTERVALAPIKAKRTFKQEQSEKGLPKTDLVRFAIPENTPSPEEDALTVPQLLANVVRTEVLDQEEPKQDELNGSDALALVDRGLDRISNGNAGLTVKKDDERRRWGLRLGNFSIDADLRN